MPNMLKNINIINKTWQFIKRYVLYINITYYKEDKMSGTIFDAQNQDIEIEDIGVLKNRWDNMDKKNIVSSFSKTRDPLALAFEHMDNRPLNKVAQDFLKDVFVDAVCFISKVFE